MNTQTNWNTNKITVDSMRPVVERDVFLLCLCDTTWCAVFRHGVSASVAAPGPTEVSLETLYIYLSCVYGH